MQPSGPPRRETDVARWIEVGVGVFMLAGLVALGYLSINLGQVNWFGGRGYDVYADFATVGGLKNGALKFNARLAATNSSMLVLGVAGLGVPTLFAAVNHSSHDAEVLSWWTAAALLVSYVAYIYYSFTTPDLRYRHRPTGATWTRTQAIVLLCVTAVATGVVSEVLVKSIEPTVRDLGVPRTFIGLIVVPFVGNAAEHFSAVRLAYRNSLDFARAIWIPDP